MAAILSAILVIWCWTKRIFKLEREVDGSNPYMKFGRNPIKNDWIRVTTTADIDSPDRWRPFCRPSWLSDVGQNPYSNLNERLMEAIHIWNLKEIWLKMIALEWTRQWILICGGHFVRQPGYQMSDKTHIRTWTRVWWKQSICEIWKKSNKKMTELEWQRQRILIGGGHFVGHLGYRMSDKTRIRTSTRGW